VRLRDFVDVIVSDPDEVEEDDFVAVVEREPELDELGDRVPLPEGE
jgi:hypothetical protein